MIAAVGHDYVLAPFDDLYCVTSQVIAPRYGPIATSTPVVVAWDTYGCSGRSITSEASGASFYYLPGCNGSPLVGGRIDGASDSVLWNLKDTGDFPTLNLSAVARAPRGGAIANLSAAFYYVDQTTHVRLNTSPAMDFSNDPVAVGASNTIYVVDLGDVYRVVPQP